MYDSDVKKELTPKYTPYYYNKRGVLRQFTDVKDVWESLRKEKPHYPLTHAKLTCDSEGRTIYVVILEALKSVRVSFYSSYKTSCNDSESYIVYEIYSDVFLRTNFNHRN